MKKKLLEDLWSAHQIIEAQAEQIGEMRKELEAVHSVVAQYDDVEEGYYLTPLAVRIDRLLRGQEVVVSVSDAGFYNCGCSCDEAPEDVGVSARECWCPACESIRVSAAGLKPQGFYTGL